MGALWEGDAPGGLSGRGHSGDVERGPAVPGARGLQVQFKAWLIVSASVQPPNVLGDSRGIPEAIHADPLETDTRRPYAILIYQQNTRVDPHVNPPSGKRC